MKRNKYYKVVRIHPDDGKILSATNCGEVTTYEIKKWTKPYEKCGPLAVFDDLGLARVFLGFERNGWMLRMMNDRSLPNYQFIIYQCSVRKSKQHELYYWNTALMEAIECTLMLPPGTVFASSVKLLKEV